jgi:flagellar protein FliS
MTKEQKQDYTLRITHANGTQMITILYDMTLDYLEDAGAALIKGDVSGFTAELNHAQRCIEELIRSLDRNYEIAGNFLQLYIFSKRELVAASARKNEENLKHIVMIFEKLRDCYRILEKQNPSPAVFEGVQDVYAGLTYSRNSLNESVHDPYAGRGYNA